MLKIKFNINKFTIIFLRRFEGKNENKRISFSLYQLQRLPSFLFSLCSVQHLPFLLSFLFQPFFFFLFFFLVLFSVPLFGEVQRLLFLLLSAFLLFLFFLPFFSFQFMCCPFFSAQKHFFQPKTILSSAQNLFQFSPKHFFSPKQFSLQPKTFFNSTQNIVLLCVPPSLLFE